MFKIATATILVFISIAVVKSNNVLEHSARINPSALHPGAASEASLRNLLRNPNPLLTPSSAAVTLHKQSENHGTGDFRYSFENSDGTKAEQVGILKPGNELNQEGIQSVTGSYSYVSPEGVPVTVNYVADENGFRAVGDHIPSGGHETVRRNTELGLLNNPALAATSGVDPNLIRQSLGNKGLPFLGNSNNPALARELLIRQLNAGNYNGLDNRGFPALGLGLGTQYPHNRFPLGNQYPYNTSPLETTYPYNRSPTGSQYPYNTSPLGTNYPYNRSPIGSQYPYNRSHLGGQSPYSRDPLGNQYPYNRFTSGTQFPYNRSPLGSQYQHNLQNPYFNQHLIGNSYVNPYQQGLGSAALKHPELAHINGNRFFP